MHHHNAQRGDNHAADDGGDAGLDQGVSEAELVDRNAKSDHRDTDDRGQTANAE